MNNTQQTLRQIQELVKADGAEAELLGHVTDLLVHTDPERRQPDTQAFDAVLEQLVARVGADEKARLARRVAPLRNGPRETVRSLAREDIGIADPVLRHSTSLTDDDLIALASELGHKHMLAIGHRRKLSPRVTDVLLDKGTISVKHIVAGNKDAAFSTGGMTLLMELSLNDEELWRRLRRRDDMVIGVMDHLIRFYKHKLEDLIPLTIEFVESGVEVAPPPEPKAAEPAPKAEAKPLEPAEPEKPKTRTTEAMLIEAARRRAGPDVIRHLADLTHVDEPTVEKCLNQATLSALMILCKANKITAAAFAALLQFREMEGGGSIAATIPHLRRYEAMHPDTARRVIELSMQRKQETGKADAQPAAG